MKRHGPRAHRTRGFALIAVVWFLVLIAAIGTYMLAKARSETALARNIRAAAGAEALADAGVAEGVFNHADPLPANRWALDGTPHLMALAGSQIAIRLYDETAKINPNLASDSLLTGLFLTLGIDRPQARRLGAAIADWVGPDGAPRPLGAKLAQYRAAGRNYGPPNAAIESLDELNLVLGMTPQLLTRARPYLTLYTEKDQPAATNAYLSPIVARAIALSAREEALAETNDDPDAPPSARPSAAPPPQPGVMLKPEEEVLDLEITAHSADGGVFARHAVVRIDPSTPKGYAVLDWRRSALSE
jgi:general secretion pathway protein K